MVRTATTTGTTTTSEAVIADGVTVGGVAVGGLTQDEAAATVTSAFERPLPLVVLRHRLFPSMKRLNASAYIDGAVAQARERPLTGVVR